ncbi:hypothetical protein MML61_10060 [Mycobacterium marinum]|uniref:hypothetical protein n=1 Tax=Mycobacterium marinum TaxID=1781 RepID=UPI000ED4464B|nr:hypothetical protein [Mycobacterium marinum]RFZ04400.1 hypothetical protein VIMS_05094 [Mycobacterium marinum]WCS20115.1 hypothetical protein MML61_10060 [Mycobacterium marinum]
MFRRQLERYLEELNAILDTAHIPITASGAVMTLPAATADLKDWVADDRDFHSRQGDDWLQVIDDFRESLTNSGPKLRHEVEGITTPIESLLQGLITNMSAPAGTPSYTIDQAVRIALLPRLERLDTELATEAAILAAWRDLVSTSEKLNRTIEELSFRRDTLWAIARRRGLNLGRFGLFHHLTSVLTDNPDAVHEELDLAAGVEHEVRPLTDEPTGQATWQRLKLCEQMLARPAARADCIVWLRLAPTSLPQYEVTHGQVTFYNADYLSSYIGYPELAHHFQVPPTEILDSQLDQPILIDDEVEWERDWHMAYARVRLPNTVIHAAEGRARTMVEALKAIHHAVKDTWRILNGSILFVDGRRVSPMSWGPKEDIPELYVPRIDRLSQDIERMPGRNETLDPQSIDDLQEAISLSAGVKSAPEISPRATVMAAVRAIEHVNVRATGGTPHWADFASDFFKKAQGRVRLTEFILRYARAAIENSPHLPPSDPRIQDFANVRQQLLVYEALHQIIKVREAADHIPTLKWIYADHWFVRGLGELETILATPATMHNRLEEQCRRFNRQLGRLKRLRNSAIHGGPVSDAACESVETFAHNLGMQCLNEVMRALLTGRDIRSHMAGYRTDHIDRYEKVRTAGDVDALFVAY